MLNFPMVGAPFLQRIKRWVLGQSSYRLYNGQEVFGAATWDSNCRAVIDQIASEAAEKCEIITTASLLRALAAHLPLEQAYGAQEAERFLRTLDAQRKDQRLKIATGPEGLVDHDVAIAVAMLASSTRKDEGGITIAKLAGAALAQPFQARAALEQAGFDCMPLLRWATHNTLLVRNHWPTGDFDDDPDSTYDLFLINDSITTQEIVTKLLEKHLAASSDAAHAMMLETHAEGQSLLAVGELDIIIGMAEAIEADARAAGFPLDVQIRPSI